MLPPAVARKQETVQNELQDRHAVAGSMWNSTLSMRRFQKVRSYISEAGFWKRMHIQNAVRNSCFFNVRLLTFKVALTLFPRDCRGLPDCPDKCAFPSIRPGTFIS